MPRRIRLSCAMALLAGVPLAPSAADLSAACKPPVAALEKTVRSDHRSITTSTSHGEDAVQGVTVGGTSYLQVRGAWRKSPLAVKDLLDQMHEDLKDAKEFGCKALADSVVDGTPVANYATHTVSGDDDVVDSRVAVAKSTGLVVSVENHVGGDASATTVTHYTYGSVKAPM